MKRIVIGFLSAAIASAVLQGAITGSIGAVINTFLFAGMFIVVLGVPGYILYNKLGWLKVWQVVIAGFVFGLGAGFILSSVYSFGDNVITGLGLFGFHGAVAAFIFWLVVLRGKSSNNQINMDNINRR